MRGTCSSPLPWTLLVSLRRDNSMMYDIAAITALMEVDGNAAAAVGDGDGLAVSGQTDRHSRDVMDSVIALGEL